jgi:hypothetical protein
MRLTAQTSTPCPRVRTADLTATGVFFVSSASGHSAADYTNKRQAMAVSAINVWPLSPRRLVPG